MMKNNILRSITLSAFITFLKAWMKVDSPSIVPLIVSLLCVGWIALYIYVNVFRRAEELERELQ